MRPSRRVRSYRSNTVVGRKEGNHFFVVFVARSYPSSSTVVVGKKLNGKLADDLFAHLHLRVLLHYVFSISLPVYDS